MAGLPVSYEAAGAGLGCPCPIQCPCANVKGCPFHLEQRTCAERSQQFSAGIFLAWGERLRMDPWGCTVLHPMMPRHFVTSSYLSVLSQEVGLDLEVKQSTSAQPSCNQTQDPG